VAVNATKSGKFSNKKNSFVFVVRQETSLRAEFAKYFHGKVGKTFPAKLSRVFILPDELSSGRTRVNALLSQKQAAQILGLSVRTLERHRLAGTGPRYARLGRLIRYRKCDLAEWVHDALRTSTSHFVVSTAASANSGTQRNGGKNAKR
jgi:predicted DNA-binding transcriptional regulator AlpA